MYLAKRWQEPRRRCLKRKGERNHGVLGSRSGGLLGLHSCASWRTAGARPLVSQMGAGAFKGAYSVLSLVGFFSSSTVLVWREKPLWFCGCPVGMRHATSLLTLIAFVLLVAAYVPGNGISSRAPSHGAGRQNLGSWFICWPMASWSTCCCLGFCCGRWRTMHRYARDRQAGKTYAAYPWGAPC